MFSPSRLRCFGALLALVLLVITVPLEAQAQEVRQSALREAFAAGDARAVLQRAAGHVEVGLLGNSSQYSRSQAVYVLDTFFDDHPPRRFEWKDTSTNGDSRFLTGRYWYEASKQAMPVYLRLSRASEGWKLQEVRIERP
ncbi:MAG: hypothetical protein BRD29_04480 [Bacteroidetes bacterium QH_2_67_10]|nr:MAG: hypothetical protein BRD29_04480 [Bacteroidetes bacterium QH_2_67_10]